MLIDTGRKGRTRSSIRQPPSARHNARTKTSPVATRSKVDRQPTSKAPSLNNSPIQLVVRKQRRHSHASVSTSKDRRSSRKWPPPGHTDQSSMTPGEAEALVSEGASTFRGYLDEVANAPPGHYRFYAVMQDEDRERTDHAPLSNGVFKEMTLQLTGSIDSAFPWISLEQPSMDSCFGKRPGTTTLNYWVGRFGSLEPVLQYGAAVRPRKIKMLTILDRLRWLENGFNEDDPDAMYKSLYNTLIEDPEKDRNPHYGMESQIADLITILSHSDWMDFSIPQNQVVAKFFDSPDLAKRQKFFHQLLLAVELYLRIHSSAHLEQAKRKLLMQLPPKIAWDLAIAQRWLENMSISRASAPSPNQSTFSFDLRSKKRQKEILLTFATALKWPNMAEVGYILEEKDRREQAIEDRSADAMSWFTGVILPGRTLPWLVMNSLIDCDKDTAGSLKYLTHMHPASGFQYRANTYWSYQCILGKVLGAARGVKQVAGWIGPCIYSPDLKRTECVRIRQAQSPYTQTLQKVDIESMAVRTSPLGPPDSIYPVADYELLLPDADAVADDIRVEKLSFQPVKDQPAHPARAGSGSASGSGAPLTFDAAVVFAFGGESFPLTLRYDVEFITAYPCQGGPHVLFYDYAHRITKVGDGLTDIKDWGLQMSSSLSSSRASSPSKPRLSNSPQSSRRHQSPHTRHKPSRLSSTAVIPSPRSSVARPAHMYIAEVLVVEAMGVSDNEVFARAWCAHWGVCAVVANVKETCLACAVREAYAACVGVVVLTEGGRKDERDKDDE